MENEEHLIPATAVKSIATGMIMMAFFTTLWAGIAFGGLHNTRYWLVLLIFVVLGLVFLINAIRLFRAAKYFPVLTSEADIAQRKKMGKWFGIIFGAEGLGIFIGINIVNNIGYPDLDIPVLALVVGLHFFPLAKVFKRTIDYYLATWSTMIAICGIIFSISKTMSLNYILAFLGVGIGIATSCYGIYMVLMAREIMKKVPALQEN
jgi:hypothetical protein